MSDTDTMIYTPLTASDQDADARFTRRDGTVVFAASDGCWVDEQGTHLVSVLDLAPVPSDAPDEDPDAKVLRQARELIDSQSNRITALTNENMRLTDRRDLAQRQLVDARAQIEGIRERIIEEAKERSWCDEVNTFLRSCNLDEWEQTYEITFEAFTVSVTISGCDDQDEAVDQARQLVTEDPSDYLQASDISEV